MDFAYKAKNKLTNEVNKAGLCIGLLLIIPTKRTDLFSGAGALLASRTKLSTRYNFELFFSCWRQCSSCRFRVLVDDPFALVGTKIYDID